MIINNTYDGMQAKGSERINQVQPVNILIGQALIQTGDPVLRSVIQSPGHLQLVNEIGRSNIGIGIRINRSGHVTPSPLLTDKGRGKGGRTSFQPGPDFPFPVKISPVENILSKTFPKFLISFCKKSRENFLLCIKDFNISVI